MIIGVYGDTRAAEHWVNLVPRSIRITTVKSGDVPRPSVHDLAVLAVFLMRMRGIPGTGTTLTDVKDPMPVWDLCLDESGWLIGTPLDVDEAKVVTLSVRQLCGSIQRRWSSSPPRAIIIDQIEDVWAQFVLGSRHGDHDVAQALREQRIAESMYWLTQSLPVLVVASERRRVVGGEVLGYEPNVNPAVDKLVDLWLEVRQVGTKLAPVRVASVRESIKVPWKLEVNQEITSQTLLDMLGLLAEPVLEEV